MGKINLLLTLIILLPALTYAQQVKEEMLKKGKDHISGYTVKYKHSKSITGETLKETLKEAGLTKAKHKKGYYVYKGETIPAISGNKNDYYYKLSGNKRKATLRFAASKGYDNFITPATDAQAAANITAFLTQLGKRIELREEIQEKQAELDKLNKDSDKTEKEKAKKQQEIDELKSKGK